MSRPIIAIDIDDVIADSTESLRLSVNRHINANLEPEHYRVSGDYHGYYERVWQQHGLKVDMKDLNAEMIADQSHMLLMPSASFAISELTKRFDIAIVTARTKDWEAATLVWLNDHFGDVFIGVHFAGRDNNESEKTKGELCQEVGAFILIDDNIEHGKSALEQGLKVILFGNYGWHKDVPSEFIRCMDWPAVLDYFNENH